MKKTGIFFHKICRENDIDWLLKGRLCSFPNLLKDQGLLDEPNIIFKQSPPAPFELLGKVHSERMIKDVKESNYY